MGGEVVAMAVTGHRRQVGLTSSGGTLALRLIVVVVQSFSHVQLCDPMDCTTAWLPFTTSLSLLKLMSIEPVMPSNHLVL